MDIQTCLWIGTIGMALGAAAILLMGKQRTRAEQAHTIIAGIVPVIAAISYFAMVQGQGDVMIHTDAAAGGSSPDKDIYFAALHRLVIHHAAAADGSGADCDARFEEALGRNPGPDRV